MSQAKVQEQLQAAPFTAEFSEQMLAELAALAQVRKYQAGQFVFREGESQPELFLITAGHVVLEMCLPASYCTRLLTLGPGDLLAWSAILGQGKMTANAICQEDVELLGFDGRKLLAFCEQDHAFGYHFMKQLSLSLAQRLLGTRLQLLDLFGTPAGTE